MYTILTFVYLCQAFGDTYILGGISKNIFNILLLFLQGFCMSIWHIFYLIWMFDVAKLEVYILHMYNMYEYYKKFSFLLYSRPIKQEY